MNTIKSLIEENVKKVLNEYMGVSDDIMKMSDDVMEMIISQYRENPIKELQAPIRVNNEYTLTHFKMFTLYTEGSEITNYASINLKLYLFDPNTIQYYTVYEALLEKGFIACNFSPSKKAITMRIPWPYTNQLDGVQYEAVIGTLNHEIKHAFQSAKRGGTVVSDQYSNATSKMQNTPEDKDSTYWLIENDIPWVYYMFDSDEIDAHIQQVYAAATKTNSDIMFNSTLEKIYSHIKKYNFLKGAYAENSIYYRDKHTKQYIDDFLSKELKITGKRFFDYCEYGLKRYRRCLMRILARWQQEGEVRDVTGNQGSFKQYAQGEIENGGAFSGKKPIVKKNPYIVKLMRFFKLI